MKIKTERIVINDEYGYSEFDNHTYISDDGKEFSFKFDCLRHELTLKIKKGIAHIPTKEGVALGFKTWYYVESYEDIKALKQYVDFFYKTDMGLFINSDEVDRARNEWISFIIDDEITFGNDDGESYYRCTFHSFKQVQKKVLREYQELKKLEEIF